MKEFFHGRRRKAGVATLGLACVVMSLWLMSFRESGYLTATFGKTNWVFRLVAGNVKFLTYVEGEAIALYETQSLNPMISLRNFTIGIGRIIVYENVNSRSEIFMWGVGTEMTAWSSIPLWTVTVPLTLLSAHLILWKPRKQKTADPPAISNLISN